MPLTPGSRLGLYEILSVLGAGGMGEVYRARDTKLGREVAIKVILDVYAADADRIARFEREAKVLASLNHPHIAALYGLEQSGAQHFLVMELVEGQTLAERLLRGPLPLEETLAIARQIADALEAAHEKGIVHRDLKPANVKVTPDDRVKVLDFGLAKAIESEAAASNVANSPTLSMMATQAGLILGTAAYMSPEQAKGLPADHRSDVFSFGSLLYEMLSGRQSFPGETAPDVLASVLVREADISRLPQDLNPRLVDLVRRCLEKQPKRRWQAIGDVRAEIEAIAAAPRASPSMVAAPVPARPLWTRTIAPLGLAIVAGALAAAAAWTLKPAPPSPVVRFAVTLPATQRFTGIARRLVAISPDGLLVAYVANRRINLRPVRDLAGTPLAGTDDDEGVNTPAFSPDGASLAFYAIGEGVIKRIALNGGAAVPLCAASPPDGLTWGADGIVFAQGDDEGQRVMRVPVGGGKPQALITLPSGELVEGPEILPGGDAVLMALATTARVGAERWDKAQIVVHSLKSGARTVVVEGGSDPRYLSTGHVAYVVGGIVYAVPFDRRTLSVTGEAFPILEGVRRASAGVTGMADFSVSPAGTLVYVPGPVTTAGGVALALADWHGVLTPVNLPPGAYSVPRVSRDGKRIAIETNDGRETFIGVHEREGTSGLRRITFGGNSISPIWSPDGTRVAFQSSREGDRGILAQASDGTGAPERLTTPAAGEVHVPQSWHGDVLLYDVVAGGSVALWQLSVKEHRAAPFGRVRSTNETGAAFSPDGRWVAYSATEERSTNTFVQPFPATGVKYMLVKSRANSPHHPVWSADGASIVYVATPGMVERVSVTTQPTFSFGNPETFSRPYQGGPPGSRRLFDTMPDGRVLGLVTPGQGSGAPPQDEMRVVMNWFEELKTRGRR